MAYSKNKFNSNCQRCGKSLVPGEGYVIPRFRGYEISCGCIMSLRSPEKVLIIEIRIKVPPMSGVTKHDPYWRLAEENLYNKMKEIFHYRWRAITRSSNLYFILRHLLKLS